MSAYSFFTVVAIAVVIVICADLYRSHLRRQAANGAAGLIKTFADEIAINPQAKVKVTDSTSKEDDPERFQFGSQVVTAGTWREIIKSHGSIVDLGVTNPDGTKGEDIPFRFGPRPAKSPPTTYDILKAVLQGEPPPKTDWYPAWINPARPGLYECESPGLLEDEVHFLYFTGREWSVIINGTAPSLFKRCREIMAADGARWRGLAFNPNA